MRLVVTEDRNECLYLCQDESNTEMHFYLRSEPAALSCQPNGIYNILVRADWVCYSCCTRAALIGRIRCRWSNFNKCLNNDKRKPVRMKREERRHETDYSTLPSSVRLGYRRQLGTFNTLQQHKGGEKGRTYWPVWAP